MVEKPKKSKPEPAGRTNEMSQELPLLQRRSLWFHSPKGRWPEMRNQDTRLNGSYKVMRFLNTKFPGVNS